MATLYSTQRTARRATPSTKQGPDEAGRLQRLYFNFTVGASDTGATDTIELIDIPANCRIMGGRVNHEALSSGGSTATLSIGITGTVAKYAAATDVDAAGGFDFANTVALYYGEQITTAFTLLGTVSVEGLDATKEIRGHVDIMRA